MVGCVPRGRGSGPHRSDSASPRRMRQDPHRTAMSVDAATDEYQAVPDAGAHTGGHAAAEPAGVGVEAHDRVRHRIGSPPITRRR